MDLLDFGVLLPTLTHCLHFIAFQDLYVWESVILSDAKLAATWFNLQFPDVTAEDLTEYPVVLRKKASHYTDVSGVKIN